MHGTCARATALAVSREEAQHASLPRARRAALVVFGPRTTDWHCSGERPLGFVARPWSDMLAAASNQQPAFAWQTRARHCATCLSGGGAARKLAAARAPCCAGCNQSVHYGNALHQREASLSLGAVSWCDLPAAASNAQSAVSRDAHGCATKLAISQEEAQHASLMRARAVSLWLWSFRAIWKGTAPPEGIPPS